MDNIMLQDQFIEKEIKECFMASAGDKTPVLDGFTMAFFVACWDVVCKDVVTAVQSFYN